MSGDTTEPSPSKYMIYELERVDDNYQLVGIKDPPDGVVPGVPQIQEDSSQTTSPATDQTQPQTIEPAEQTLPQESTDDSDVAQYKSFQEDFLLQRRRSSFCVIQILRKGEKGYQERGFRHITQKRESYLFLF